MKMKSGEEDVGGGEKARELSNFRGLYCDNSIESMHATKYQKKTILRVGTS